MTWAYLRSGGSTNASMADIAHAGEVWPMAWVHPLILKQMLRGSSVVKGLFHLIVAFVRLHGMALSIERQGI